MPDALLSTVLSIVATIINLYIFVIFAAVIASWLIAFGVVNMRNEAVRSVMRILDALTEPVFRQVRRILPPIAGLDLSPLIVLIALYAIERFLALAFPMNYYGSLI